MDYNLIKDVMELVVNFEQSGSEFPKNLEGFQKWVHSNLQQASVEEPNWEGKENGRTPESVISTLLVHLNRYGKMYAKSAILASSFSTQDEFSYLINLKSFGMMSKMDLIKKNVHEKSAGMQIINRIIIQGWVAQTDSEIDKRSKLLTITELGLKTLEDQMGKIRAATQIVAGDLDQNEKMELIRILNKLNDFHLPIYQKNTAADSLLSIALEKISEN